MPVSKKPRKKSKIKREIDARRKILRGDFKSEKDIQKTFEYVEESQRKMRRQCEQISWMLSFVDKRTLLQAFTHAFFSLDRWSTTDDYSDFNRVSSSLMLGALLHKAMGVQEKDLLEDIQHAAYMTVMCARLRNHKKPVPASNIEPVKHGLIIAQDLMMYAYDNERQALINVLKHNSKDNLRVNPGLEEQHERFILGRHYDTVRAWELEDGELLKRLEENHGRLDEQERAGEVYRREVC